MFVGTRRRFLGLGMGAAGTALGVAAPVSSPLTPERVHQELIQGNRRFVSGHPRHPHSSLAWVKRIGREGQHPHAVILCCSDSRVAPEILFDKGVGDLFVVRVAGNVANEDEIGSIEYAVEHLSVPLCVVLGHTGCGAVRAVVEGEKLPKEIEHLVAPIQNAFHRAKTLNPQSTERDLMEATVRFTVEDTVATLADGRTILGERTSAGRLRIEGAVYDLETGHVHWLAPAPKPV